MENPITPSVEVVLDGKVHTLKYRRGDFAMAEYLLKQQGFDIRLISPGAELFWGTAEQGQALGLDQFKIGVLLYVGLLHDNRALTLEQAQLLINFDNLFHITEKVSKAVNDALQPLIPKSESAATEDAAENPLAGESTGAFSGPTPATTSGSPTPNVGS